jgi:PAS domain S-box-containing protein
MDNWDSCASDNIKNIRGKNPAEQIDLIMDSMRDAYYQCDLHGRITFVNSVALELYGCSDYGDMLGLDSSILYCDPFGREKLLRQLELHKRVNDWIIKGRSFKGEVIWVSLSIQYLYDDNDEIIGTHGFVRSVDERIRAELSIKNKKRQILETQTILDSIINSSCDLIWAVDIKNFGLITFNDRAFGCAKKLFNLEIKNGDRPEFIFPSKQLSDTCYSFYRKTIDEGSFTREFELPSGECFILSFNLMRNGEECIGISAFVKVITEMKKVQKELFRRELLLTEIQGITATGGWEYDVASGKSFWTDEMYNILEIDKKDVVDYLNTSLNTYDSVEAAEIFKNFRKCIGKGIPYEMTLPITTYKGNRKWIRCKAKPVYQDDKIIKVVGSYMDVTDDISRELKLIKAQEKAEESDKLKSAFLMNLSHEIRTPMNGILGFLKLLEEPNLKENDRSDFMRSINKSCYRLMNTINDLVEMSKIEIGDIWVNNSIIDVNELFDSLAQAYSSKCKEKGLELVFDNQFQNDGLNIVSDKYKLESILSNLIKNAIKFSDQGEIRLGVNVEENRIHFYVSDSGCGIPDDKKSIIFDSFVQADNGISRKYEGVGVGLTLVKAYLKALGGNIEINSKIEQGTKVIVSIPFQMAEDYINDVSNKSLLETKKKILVAEDDEINYYFLKRLLEKNYDILHAVNENQILEILDNDSNVALILLDLKLSDRGNGIEIAKKLRGKNIDIPIIAQSAYATEKNKLEAINAGCDEFIAKPFNSNYLKALIAKYLKSSES